MSVLSQKEITEYTSLFDGTGLTPVSFEIEAQAIARAVIPNEDMETYMILDFGRTRTGISVVSESIVRFASTVDVGSDMITLAVEKYFSVNTADAERMKNEKGVTKSESDKDFPAPRCHRCPFYATKSTNFISIGTRIVKMKETAEK